MKVLLLDADGVTLKRGELFSDKFSREYGVPSEEIIPFFKNEFRLCQQGKMDVKEALAEYLPKWNWDKGTDEFLQYWFQSDTHSDEEVFAEVDRIRGSGIRCYLATDQEKYKANYIREELDFKNRLDGCFFSYELGVRKMDPSFFGVAIKELGVEPADITYFDDDPGDVQSAASCSINAHVYSGVDDLKIFSHGN